MSHSKDIFYSDKYKDDEYEYRHVMLPKEIAKLVPKTHLMSETEWRSLGVQQSVGWIHYMRHDPGLLLNLYHRFISAMSWEPHILLFRRPVT